jgi:hypothetical protein
MHTNASLSQSLVVFWVKEVLFLIQIDDEIVGFVAMRFRVNLDGVKLVVSERKKRRGGLNVYKKRKENE